MKASENVVSALALAGCVVLGSAGCLGRGEASVSGDDTPRSRLVQAAMKTEVPGFRAPGEEKEGIMHPNERIGEAAQPWLGWGGRWGGFGGWGGWGGFGGWGGGFYPGWGGYGLVNPWWGGYGLVNPYWGWGGWGW